MTNLELVHDKDAVEVQASAWLARFDSMEMSEEELNQFSDWLAADPSHEQAFEELRLQWKRFSFLSELSDSDKVGIENRIEATAAKPKRKYPYFYPRVAAVAAVFLLVFIAYNRFDQFYLPENTYQTDIGEQRTIALEDGTSIMLNTDTRLQIDFSSGKRMVSLQSGEAYFEVAHDSARPFVVTIGDREVRAVGTAFSILRQNKDFSVLVTDGVVEVSENAHTLRSIDRAAEPQLGQQQADQDRVYVRKDQKIVVGSTLATAEALSASSVRMDLSWQTGKLEFDGETLDEVVSEFDRYTNQQIFLVGDEIKRLKVGGVFEAGNVEALVSALELMLPVKVIKLTPYLTFLVHDEAHSSS